MLSINDLKKGTIFELDNLPHAVLESHHVKIGRGGAVLQTKLKNLITGTTIARNFKQADHFEGVEIEKEEVVFIYKSGNEYWFHMKDDKSNRFSLREEQVGEQRNFLKQNQAMEAQKYNDTIIRIVLPIKMEYIVTEAPPTIRGNTADGGTKTVTIETGAQIQTPLFIETGDTIRVNTEKSEYAERVKRGL